MRDGLRAEPHILHVQDEPRPRLLGNALRELTRDTQSRRPRVPEDVRPVGRSTTRVQRHDDGSEPQDRQHEDRDLEPVRGEDRHPVSLAHAEPLVEPRGERVHARGEGRIRELPL